MSPDLLHQIYVRAFRRRVNLPIGSAARRECRLVMAAVDYIRNPSPDYGTKDEPLKPLEVADLAAEINQGTLYPLPWFTEDEQLPYQF